MRRTLAVVATALGAGGLGLAATTSVVADDRAEREYVVVYEQGASASSARAAVQRAGGTVVEENAAVGVATVRSTSEGFRGEVARSGAVEGAASQRAIGRAPSERRKRERDLERLPSLRQAAEGPGARPKPVAGEPLSDLQWDMRMIGATPNGSYATQQGAGVKVGIIDTGVDGTHPDVAPNFDAELSRNFTVDRPEIDGDCYAEADRSCQDAADVDEDGHGTHVAGTIASPLNGAGIGGVAPKADIVNLRAGQDSGYFFLGSVIDALTYAGDHGIDVVNMSFYVDPWLFNCRANPADTAAQQAEQQLVIDATQRALTYARDRGVTLVAAEGNGNTDLDRPVADATSPDYPVGTEKTRAIDDGCLTVPTESDGVVGVTSVGPSKRKAYYSDYGLRQADVSAPGGDVRDGYNTPSYQDPASNLILAPYPATIGRANGDIDATGTPTTPFVVEQGGAYYQYLQGTSMAAPHAAGVAAVAVGAAGTKAPKGGGGGKTLAPERTEGILRQTATETACPTVNPFVYPDPDLGPAYTARCEGTTQRNGFYGEGIVSANAAAQAK